MQSMSDKIEQMQQARGEPVAFGHLEDRIVTLVQRLDASDARLGHLEAVERGLTDLLVHIEDLRANKQSSALRAEDTSGIDALKQDVARTQSTVEAMHGTLGQVVERLTVIEKDIHGDRRPPAALDRRHPRTDTARRKSRGRHCRRRPGDRAGTGAGNSRAAARRLSRSMPAPAPAEPAPIAEAPAARTDARSSFASAAGEPCG